MREKTGRGYRVKAVSMILAFVLSFVFTVTASGQPAVADSVKIGQATATEKGGIRNGKAGDQTGGEVAIASWSYNSKSNTYNHWKYVFRVKDPETAAKLAKKMKQACANDYIGYDQKGTDRGTFYDEAQKLNWKIKDITTKCETTCASLIGVCLNAVGFEIPRYWDSSLVYKDLKATGQFYIFKSKAYTASTQYLEPGDILLSPGMHCCMVVSSPNEPGTTPVDGAAITPSSSSAADPADSSAETDLGSTPSEFQVGLKYQLNCELNVRSGPGTSHKIRTYSSLNDTYKAYSLQEESAILASGSVVTCKKVSGTWIRFTNGWICGKYGDDYYITEYTATDEQKALREQALKYAASERLKVVLTKGSTYKLNKALKVRTGPGTNYAVRKRSKLTANAKRSAQKGTYAVLKKGTKVSCLEVSGRWIRIPSGWIYAGTANIKKI